MPIGVMRFPTASSPLVEEHREDPVQLEGRLRAVLRGAGARLEGRLYFDLDREKALAFVRDFDIADVHQRKAILTAFRATYQKLMTPEEAAMARELERELPNVEPEPEPGGPQAA